MNGVYGSERKRIKSEKIRVLSIWSNSIDYEKHLRSK